MRPLTILLLLFVSAICVQSTWAGVISSNSQYSDGAGAETWSFEPEMPVDEREDPSVLVTPINGMLPSSMSDQCPQTQAAVSPSGLIFKVCAGRFESPVNDDRLPDRIIVRLQKVPISAFDSSNDIL